MKKVGILLHETSIVNFSFIWKLIKRYSLFTMIVPLIIFTIFGYKYYTQKNIFLIELGFNNVSSGGATSPSAALTAALGEKSSDLDPYEIISLSSNVDFKHSIAEAVYKLENFGKLNFTPFQSKNNLTHEMLFGECNNAQECIVSKLSNLIGGMFSIARDKVLDTRFRINVRHGDRETAIVLIKTISKVLERQRVEKLQKFISTQVSLTAGLIKAKQVELNKIGAVKVMEELKQKEVLLEGVIAQLSQYQSSFMRIQERLTNAETILNQTKKTLGQNIDLDKLGRSERGKILKDQIQKLREDINSLELAADTIGTKSSKVLAQLKRDLSRKESEYKKIRITSRGVSSFDTLLERKGKAASFTEFDYKVMKKQYTESKKRYDQLNLEKERLIQQKSELELKFDQMKPSIEYLKLLKQKSVQLELAESTVVSDLSFDAKISSIRKYKKLSKLKVLFASSSVSAFITLLCLVLFYLFDNRIYDEEELRNNFSDLDVIGNTPDFQ